MQGFKELSLSWAHLREGYPFHAKYFPFQFIQKNGSTQNQPLVYILDYFKSGNHLYKYCETSKKRKALILLGTEYIFCSVLTKVGVSEIN